MNAAMPFECGDFLASQVWASRGSQPAFSISTQRRPHGQNSHKRLLILQYQCNWNCLAELTQLMYSHATNKCNNFHTMQPPQTSFLNQVERQEQCHNHRQCIVISGKSGMNQSGKTTMLARAHITRCKKALKKYSKGTKKVLKEYSTGTEKVLKSTRK